MKSQEANQTTLVAYCPARDNVANQPPADGHTTWLLPIDQNHSAVDEISLALQHGKAQRLFVLNSGFGSQLNSIFDRDDIKDLIRQSTRISTWGIREIQINRLFNAKDLAVIKLLAKITGAIAVLPASKRPKSERPMALRLQSESCASMMQQHPAQVSAAITTATPKSQTSHQTLMPL
jgi:hypothetical protein